MPDTIRSLTALQTLLGDNATGDISANDLRDFLVSAYRPQAITPGGRLTLTTAVPVTTSDVTAASTLYYTPFRHNAVGLYDGTSWTLNTFAEVSIALSGLTSGKNYDVFLYNNAGTLTLELLAWTNDTTRATALVMQDGVYAKTGALTRRYLGTIRTTGTTTTEDSGGGTTTQVGGKRYVWNAHNRVRRHLTVFDTTDTWSYTTNTVRQANGATGNKVEFVVGLAEEAAMAQVNATAFVGTNSARSARVGVGVDSITGFSGLVPAAYNTSASSGYFAMTAAYRGLPAAGYRYFAWLESGADGTSTFLGDNGGDGQLCGLYAETSA